MASNLNHPPAPDWWEVQAFQLTRREAELQAEERWLEQEQTVHFPARCRQRDLDYQQQKAELEHQSQARLTKAFIGNALWVVRRGVVRPALTRSAEAINLDREIDALRRTFHQLHERDSHDLVRHASELRRKRDLLEVDKQALLSLASSYGVIVTL